ncbi:hypothetical protein F383_34531 [Gossypium arboreum]|uniref:Uncharacterized protein n=1 Tax=Gossypium arboreum TaxID=29729 RepID=A0A0B0MYH9_GOSAR|nr:hypothetical protein F383_34531 [Gossypium arboreum]
MDPHGKTTRLGLPHTRVTRLCQFGRLDHRLE